MFCEQATRFYIMQHAAVPLADKQSVLMFCSAGERLDIMFQ